MLVLICNVVVLQADVVAFFLYKFRFQNDNIIVFACFSRCCVLWRQCKENKKKKRQASGQEQRATSHNAVRECFYALLKSELLGVNTKM